VLFRSLFVLCSSCKQKQSEQQEAGKEKLYPTQILELQEVELQSVFPAVLKGQEVSDILSNYKASIRKNEYREKQIKSLGNAVNYTQKLLIAGESTYTEVLSAQRDLLSAQLDQVDDKLEQLQYEVNLYKALGGGTD
jgi:multidrug efflux system outer membrane protein